MIDLNVLLDEAIGLLSGLDEMSEAAFIIGAIVTAISAATDITSIEELRERLRAVMDAIYEGAETFGEGLAIALDPELDYLRPGYDPNPAYQQEEGYVEPGHGADYLYGNNNED